MNSLSQLNTFSATPVEFFDGRTNTTTTSAYRYAFNGVVSTDKTVMQNLEAMANACGSWVSYDAHDGKWSVVINKSDASIASFNNSNIIGSLTVNGTDINELYNQVKCQFPHIDLNDNPDYINIEIPEGERNANEPLNSLEMQFDILNDPVQAQLIGAINLKQSRVDKVVRFTTDYSKLGLKAGHIIDITSDIYGFVNKKFRITSLNEQDTDDGNIVLDITALEYDDTVYSTADLYRYPVTNSTGIIGIGTIGKPGLPEVVKTEVASLPKITVTSTAPTGIVEEMEFWYTRDVPPGNNVDATRSYSLLGRVKPTNGTTFAFGTAVSLDVSTLGTGNFLIKSRGVNATTAGQYSDPSGVVYYAPVQTTDAIGPETSLIDETGGLIGTLALTYLLNNLDQLFKGNVSVGSIFDQIFGLFKDETGTDIVAQATANVSALGISRDGSPITSTTGNLDFRGTAISSVGVTGNDVSITIDGANYTAGNGIAISEENVISSTLVANVSPGFAKAKAGNATILSSASNTINFVPGPGAGDGSKIKITGIEGTNTVVIDLDLSANLATLGSNINAGGSGNVTPPPPPVTTLSSTLTGKVFPMLFGDGPTEGASTRAGIFTHDHMVFAGSTLGGLIKSTNVITGNKDLTLTANGIIRDFYKFPSLSSWARKPWYDESIIDKYDYDSKISVYYSTATYAGGALDAQNWSPWTLIASNNGETGFNGVVTITVPPVPAVYANTWSNPQPTITSVPDAPYVVEEALTNQGVGSTSDVDVGGWVDAGNALANYDPFKVNVLIVNLVTPEIPGYTYDEVHNDLAKSNTVATGTQTPIAFNSGANNLIMFGVSVYNAPTNTPVASNTVFGHATPYFVNTYPDAVAFKSIVNNGSRFVGISISNSKVFWSDDGKTWDRVKLDAAVTNDNAWVNTSAFEFAVYDGSKFIIYDLQNGAATSTDGKSWTEYSNATLHSGTAQVCATAGHYLAVGSAGVQTSSDGITWNTAVKPASFGGNSLTSVVWDGSQYIVGSRWTSAGGAVMHTSPDGVTWTALTQASNPSASQAITASNYASLQQTVDFYNTTATYSLL